MLYIVATPIGNLHDLSFRALEILKNTQIIIAENPAHTAKLVNHYELGKKEYIQFADHNELQALPKLLGKLKTNDAALVTDAGTPGISDPGFRLVKAATEANISVVPIPGASAAITALSASGLPTDKFLFVGFLGKTEPKVLKALEEASGVKATLIAYESPERILKTLRFIAKAFPEASIVIARELTKIHEEFIRGTSQELLNLLNSKPSIKGEIVLLASFKGLNKNDQY